jgi:purine-binding chemotaxis protein CheW
MNTQGGSKALKRPETEASIQLVTFSLADELFCLDILKVQEIIRTQDITPVPHTPGFVDGVITLRGKIVPVIDLRTRFGLMRTDHSPETRVIVISVNNILLGLVVDAVHEVTNLEESKISHANTMGSELNDYVSSVGKLRGRLVTLIDVDAIGVPLSGALAA